MIRIWIFVLIIAGFATLLPAQTRGGFSPSLSLSNVFQGHFPEAENIIWKKDASGYEVAFVSKTLKMIARYSLAEVWLQTDIEVPLNLIPEDAMSHLRKNFPQATIVKTGYLDAPQSRFFKIDILQDGRRRQLRYNDQGEFIQ
ncbi:MAG: hypothetical protein R3C61_02590 [Bacteroidia bacterium]